MPTTSTSSNSGICPADFKDCTTKKCCYKDATTSQMVISHCDNPCFCYGEKSVAQTQPDGSVICGGVGAFVAVVNINAARDDYFNLVMNGTQIGYLDFSTNSQRGYLFLSYTQTYINQVKALMPSTIIWSTKTVNVDLNGSLCMNNAGRQNNGNYGNVYAGNLNGLTSTQHYTMNDGGSQCFTVSTQ